MTTATIRPAKRTGQPAHVKFHDLETAKQEIRSSWSESERMRRAALAAARQREFLGLLGVSVCDEVAV